MINLTPMHIDPSPSKKRKAEEDIDEVEEISVKFRKVEIEAQPLPPPHHINRSWSAEDLRIDPSKEYNMYILKKV